MKRDTNANRDQRSTAAAELLKELTDGRRITLGTLAILLDVSESQLAECRDGKGRLTPQIQLRLAHLAPSMSSRLRDTARRLEAQARAALRFEADGADTRHSSYPRQLFR